MRKWKLLINFGLISIILIAMFNAQIIFIGDKPELRSLQDQHELTIASWDTQTSGVSSDLNSIYFVDVYKGWAVGDTGVILHTTDGGTTWIAQTSGTALDLEDLFFVDSNTGWIVGDNTLLKTTNGGTNWTSLGSTKYLYSVFFIDANHGWIGGIGTIQYTSDGGTTWWTETSAPYLIQDIVFLSTTTGWAADWSGKVWNTTTGDLGVLAIWTNTAITSDYLEGIDFIDANTGWVCGGGFSSGLLFKTSNGGTTWNLKTLPLNCPSLYAIDFMNSNDGWAVSVGGTILHTNDGGNTWKYQYPDLSSAFLMGVCFVDVNNGWIAGWSGEILHTDNGGIDNTIPQINSPSDIIYKGSGPSSINWYPTDDNPDTYIITKNGSIVKSGTLWYYAGYWYVSVDFDVFQTGVYNYTCWVNDTSGNSNSDTVIVTVLQSPTIIPSFELLFIMLGLLSLILMSKINRKFAIY